MQDILEQPGGNQGDRRRTNEGINTDCQDKGDDGVFPLAPVTVQQGSAGGCRVHRSKAKAGILDHRHEDNQQAQGQAVIRPCPR